MGYPTSQEVHNLGVALLQQHLCQNFEPLSCPYITSTLTDQERNSHIFTLYQINPIQHRRVDYSGWPNKPSSGRVENLHWKHLYMGNCLIVAISETTVRNLNLKTGIELQTKH